MYLLYCVIHNMIYPYIKDNAIEHYTYIIIIYLPTAQLYEIET